jgi:hypothetical protein
MDNISITLVDKISELETGVAFLLSLGVGDVFYDAMYWVDKEHAVLEVSDDDLEALGLDGPDKEDKLQEIAKLVLAKYPTEELLKEIKGKVENDN